MSIKDFLNDLVAKRAPGPNPSFNVLDVIRFIKLLAKFGPMGRGRISKELGLGEGVVRTILKRLLEADLVTMSRSGCSLTHKGVVFWSKIEEVLQDMVEIERNELTLAPYNVAVLVRERAHKVRNGLEQRDAAVMSGAKGATTIIFKGNKMIIPGVSVDLERDYPLAFREIMRLMRPKEGDVIIISSADSPKNAEYGALAAAWSII